MINRWNAVLFCHDMRAGIFNSRQVGKREEGEKRYMKGSESRGYSTVSIAKFKGIGVRLARFGLSMCTNTRRRLVHGLELSKALA